MGESMKRFLLLLLFLTACATQAPEKINIGVSIPLSGVAAYYGEISQQGIELAREELADPKFQVFFEDNYFTAKGGADAYNKLKNVNDIDAIITGSSQASLAILPQTTADNVLQMAIFATNEKYGVPNDLAFRISTTASAETVPIVEYVLVKNITRLSILYLDNDFGAGFKDALKEKVSTTNIEIVGEEAYLLEAEDIRTQLLKLKEANPQVIFIIGTAKHFVLILKQAKELGIKAQFMSLRSAQDPIIIQNAREAAEGFVYSYTFDSTKDDAQEFVTRFKQKYGREPDAYAAEGYEAYKLIVAAFNECDKNTDCIKEFFKKPHRTVFGEVKFDEKGDPLYSFHMKTIKNGEFVKVE